MKKTVGMLIVMLNLSIQAQNTLIIQKGLDDYQGCHDVTIMNNDAIYKIGNRTGPEDNLLIADYHC